MEADQQKLIKMTVLFIQMDMNEALIHPSYAENSPDQCERHALVVTAGTGDNPA